MIEQNIKSAVGPDTPAAGTKPCLVQTSQGFTVSYKEKFLYSKYSPQKSILQLIQNTNPISQTIFLCISPVLSYGLKELSEKLPEDCILLGCEFDKELFDFEQQHISDYDDIKNFSFLSPDELVNLGPILTNRNVSLKSGFTLPSPGTFRRIIRIDFSAGNQFHLPLYEQLVENATSAIMTFWANRVTLVKFGRKYCSNFFQNLKVCDKTIPIQKYFNSVEKQIIVFGAGESAADGIKMILSHKDGQSAFYILCADTVLQPLIASGIEPDGVFIEEVQNVISKCFIGTQNSNTHVFAGLSSIHAITRFFKPEQISFFTTEFVQADFIDRFDKMGILPPKNKPFGSVGITTYYYATLFRKDDSVPVNTYGLDFAYSAGRTHTKGAMADNARFLTSSRLKPDANFGAAFNEPAFKKNEKMYTTPIMARYAQIMRHCEEHSDVAIHEKESIDTDGLPRFARNDIIQKERESLLELKSLFTGKTKLPENQLEEKLTQQIKQREYLYLHFPDGHKFTYTQSFLNRVRVEVDYYLKVLNQ